MLARVLFISDLHKRYKDSTSIKGQLEVQQKIQEDIINFNKAYGVTHNIILGDWYDRGFHGLGQAFGAIEMDRRISESVNGNVYLCVGNHFYLERDENPEMYIIQPNAHIHPQLDIPIPDKPIFKVVQALQIGSVLISFFHFSKVNKEYYHDIPEDVTFHIGVYHDDNTLPSWVREQAGYTGGQSQVYFNKIYQNVDLAIHGHIHTKIGSVSVPIGDRKVPMIIPGSLGITQNKESLKHNEVLLPLLEINDDSSVKMQLVPFSTHLSELRFFDTNKKRKVLDDAELQRKIASKDIHIADADDATLSLSAYLNNKGYKDVHLNLVNAAIADTLCCGTAVAILNNAEGY